MATLAGARRLAAQPAQLESVDMLVPRLVSGLCQVDHEPEADHRCQPPLSPGLFLLPPNRVTIVPQSIISSSTLTPVLRRPSTRTSVIAPICAISLVPIT